METLEYDFNGVLVGLNEDNIFEKLLEYTDILAELNDVTESQVELVVSNGTFTYVNTWNTQELMDTLHFINDDSVEYDQTDSDELWLTEMWKN